MLCTLVMQMEKQGLGANAEDKKEPGEGLDQGLTGTCGHVESQTGSWL